MGTGGFPCPSFEELAWGNWLILISAIRFDLPLYSPSQPATLSIPSTSCLLACEPLHWHVSILVPH